MLDISALRALVNEVIEELAPGAQAASISDDTSLIQLGIGSMALFHFVSKLESRLEISIPDAELSASNFETVATVLQTLKRLLAP